MICNRTRKISKQSRLVGTYCLDYWRKSRFSQRRSKYCLWKRGLHFVKTFKQQWLNKKLPEVSESCRILGQEKNLSGRRRHPFSLITGIWCRRPALLQWLFLSRWDHDCLRVLAATDINVLFWTSNPKTTSKRVVRVILKSASHTTRILSKKISIYVYLTEEQIFVTTDNEKKREKQGKLLF